MATLKVSNTSIKAIAACVPKETIKNIDYEYITLQERELLIKTTGIAERRIATNGICTSDMCLASAEKILNDLNIDRTTVDLLVFVSQSPDYLVPATSVILQHRLGLSKQTMAFDIMLGCSGYVYGLSVVSNLVSSGKFRNALLLVGDKSTHSQNYKDKSAYPIFGDAGTATLIQYNENAADMDFILQSDGSGWEAIMIPDGGIRNPINAESEIEIEYDKGIVRSRKNLHMQGLDVFNFSISEAPKNIHALLKDVNKTIEEIDYVLFHQANKLMNETIRKKIKAGPEKVPYSLDQYGNTSSASIPLTIVTRMNDEIKKNKKTVLLSGFGVGLSWASVITELDHVYCPPLIEL